jgi:hypothetical protein
MNEMIQRAIAALLLIALFAPAHSVEALLF